MGIENMSVPDEWMPEKTPREFFLKIYGWEDLIDLSQHVEEAIGHCDIVMITSTIDQTHRVKPSSKPAHDRLLISFLFI